MTALILYAGMMLGESWKVLTQIGHEASIVFVVVAAIVIGALYIRHKKRKTRRKALTQSKHKERKAISESMRLGDGFCCALLSAAGRRARGR